MKLLIEIEKFQNKFVNNHLIMIIPVNGSDKLLIDS